MKKKKERERKTKRGSEWEVKCKVKLAYLPSSSSKEGSGLISADARTLSISQSPSL